MSKQFTPGQLVWWHYERTSPGYGCSIQVPSVFVQYNAKSAKIVALRDNGTTTIRSVSPEKLQDMSTSTIVLSERHHAPLLTAQKHVQESVAGKVSLQHALECL